MFPLPVRKSQPEHPVDEELERRHAGQHYNVANVKFDVADVLSHEQHRIVDVFTGDLWPTLWQSQNVVQVVGDMHVQASSQIPRLADPMVVKGSTKNIMKKFIPAYLVFISLKNAVLAHINCIHVLNSVLFKGFYFLTPINSV